MDNWLIAVSASIAYVVIQFLCLQFKLYFSPLLSKVISSLEKMILVLLTTLGWNFTELSILFLFC